MSIMPTINTYNSIGQLLKRTAVKVVERTSLGDKFFNLAKKYGKKAPEGWMQTSNFTWYLDRQSASDLEDIGAAIAYGEDKDGRKFVTFNFYAVMLVRQHPFIYHGPDDDRNHLDESRHDVHLSQRSGTATVFQRYSGGSQGVWVSGGDSLPTYCSGAIDDDSFEKLIEAMKEKTYEQTAYKQTHNDYSPGCWTKEWLHIYTK